MMLRGRIPKVNKIKGRNLQNLHVIPTASVASCPQNQLMPSLIPLISSAQTQGSSGADSRMNFYNLNMQNNDYNFNTGRKRQRQRKKDAKRGSYWNKIHNLKPVMCNAKVLEESAAVKEEETEEKMSMEEAEKMENEEIEKGEVPSDAPNEENYFEEVEVASVEADAKQEILVGYRKTKRHYLKYKKKNFFRPKIFELWERTFVNCLNLQDDIDVDVVSEAEYEYETDHLDRSDSQEMLPKFVEINEDEAREDSKEAEPKDVKTQIEKDMDQDKQTEIKDNGDINQAEANQLLVNDENTVSKSKSIVKIYKTCLENNNDFMQGKSLIQNSLDSLKSHVIGLEYVIEVQNESKDSALKYYCVLCSEDLSIQDINAICVINHISSCKHVVKYLFIFLVTQVTLAPVFIEICF